MSNSNVVVMRMHVRADELLRFGDGLADADEAEGIGRHLAVCTQCAALSQEMFADDAPRTLGRALQQDDRPPRLGRALAVAAAVAAVVIGIAVIVSRPDAPSPPRAQIRATSHYDRPEWTALIRDALARGTVTVAAPEGSPGHDALRGGGTIIAGEMVPSATSVESAQPELSWPAVAGARFEVSIVSGDEVIARSGTIEGNRWTPERPLIRGRSYAWQVRVARGKRVETLPAPPRPNPRFRVLADDEVRDLAAARQRYPHDHLLLGVLAAHHGLREEARRELAQSPAAVRVEGNS
jgi:hypothetical protein